MTLCYEHDTSPECGPVSESVIMRFSVVFEPNIGPNRRKFWDCIVDLQEFVGKSAEGRRCITA